MNMKLYQSLFRNAVLIATFLISATLSAQAKEVANYVQAYNSQSPAQVLVAAAGADKQDHGGTSSDQKFMFKPTNAFEFTFAIVAVIVGLIASDIYQRNREKQQIALGESNGNHSVSIDAQSEHQDLSRMS